MPNITVESRLWPFYDKIYSTKQEADAAVSVDDIMIGRCVLIKYCETEMLTSRKLEIIGLSDEQAANLVGDEALFYNCFVQDGRQLKDRLLLQKTAHFDGNEYKVYYQEICFLSLSDSETLISYMNDVVGSNMSWNDTYLN